MAGLAQIWRHPIKGIGCEALLSTDLAVGRPIAGDRAWAVLREGGADTGAWQKCSSFLRGANGPSLMAVHARTDGTRLHLSHPHRPDLSIDPATDGAQLIDWVAPLWPDGFPPPSALIKAPEIGMADMNFPSISILNLSSLADLSDKIGQSLDTRRFRGNLWVDGWDAWAERDLIGKTVRIGEAELEVVAENERCLATHANPDTGLRDADVLPTLANTWGHKNFGIYAKVTRGGQIRCGDQVEIL